MNLIRGISIIVFAILIITVTAIFPVPGAAQQILRGEFSLARKVRWGDSVLPMGDYMYFVEPNPWPPAVRVEQKDGSFIGVFIPQTMVRPGRKGKSGITLGAKGSDSYVMSIHLPDLAGDLDFPAPGTESGKEPDEGTHAQESGPSTSKAMQYLTIINPNHEKISPEEVERVYLKACELVENEFKRSTPIRPRLLLRVGADGNKLQYPMGEIRLKKWDEYRFADAVVDLALHDMVSTEERVRLGDAAVHEAGATVNVCELKACVN